MRTCSLSSRHAYFALLSLLFIHSAGAAPEPQQAPAAIDDRPVTALIEKAVAEHHIPGMAAALVRDGEVIWARGFGLADVRANRPVTPDTLFVMASVSKTMVAAALMHAVEHGRVTLDADIDNWLPFPVRNPNFPDAKITLRQLATHSSGILDNYLYYGGPANYHFGGDNPTSLGAYLAAYLVPGGAYYDPAKNFASYRPGGQWQYSNVGAALTGFVIESATGMPFDAYCHKFIFEPLGMVNTGWHQREVDMTRHAIPYDTKVGFAPYEHYGLATWPDGGLRTTVLDLSRFVAMILQGGSLHGVTILKPATVEAMSAAQGVAIEREGMPKGAGEAIFWQRLTQSDGSVRLRHGGSDPGAATMVMLDPKKHVGVIEFTNTSPSKEIGEGMEQVIDLLFKASGR